MLERNLNHRNLMIYGAYNVVQMEEIVNHQEDYDYIYNYVHYQKGLDLSISNIPFGVKK